MEQHRTARVTPVAGRSLVRTSAPHHGDGTGDHLNGPPA